MTKSSKKVLVETTLPNPADKKYLQLSEVVNDHLINKQRADTFIKEFKSAVNDREFKAAPLPSTRFTQPKLFRHREGQTSYQKETKDYAIENSPAFHEWYAETNRRLTASREGTVKVNMDTINGGLINFDDLFEAEASRLSRAKLKGATLGKTRGKAAEAATEEVEEEEVAAAPVKKAPAKKPAKKAAPAPVAEVEEEDDEDIEAEAALDSDDFED